MLNKHNLNIAKLADKDQSRFTLDAIRVTPTETAGVLLSHARLAFGIRANDYTFTETGKRENA